MIPVLAVRDPGAAKGQLREMFGFRGTALGHLALGDQEILVSSQETINDESLLLTYSRFHNHYRTGFPGKIRNMGCTGAHICYVAMGRAEAAVITNLSYQDLGASRVILEAAGGKIYKMNGQEFFPNEYLDGPRINDRLLVVGPDRFSEVCNYLDEVT